MDIIATTNNKKYKLIKSLQQKKYRMSEGLYTVEGSKSVSDAINSGCCIKLIAVRESYFMSTNIQYENIETIVIKDELFDGLCDTKSPQGIIAVIKIISKNDFVPDINKAYIYCDNISDPGNLGTIIRTADAAGFGGVLLSKGCVDIYSPKTVRSSMGSFFNIEIIPNYDYNSLFKMKEQGFNLYCGALTDDSTPYTDVDFTQPSVIIVGNEANGVSEDILYECKHIIIPILGNAESLNVGVAAAVMMYETVRQRKGENNG